MIKYKNFSRKTRYALVAFALLPAFLSIQSPSYATGNSPKVTPTQGATNAKPTPLPVAKKGLNADLLNIQHAAQAYNRNTVTTNFATTPKAYQLVVTNGRLILSNMNKALQAFQSDLKIRWANLPQIDSAKDPAKDTLKAYGDGMAAYIAAQVLDLNMVQACINGKTSIPACFKVHYKDTLAPETAAIKQLTAPSQALTAWTKKYHRTSVS